MIYTVSANNIWLASYYCRCLGEGPKFCAQYKMVNVTGNTQPPRNIIEHTNLRRFGYHDYLAISRFKLLSYVIVVDV